MARRSMLAIDPTGPGGTSHEDDHDDLLDGPITLTDPEVHLSAELRRELFGSTVVVKPTTEPTSSAS